MADQRGPHRPARHVRRVERRRGARGLRLGEEEAVVGDRQRRAALVGAGGREALAGHREHGPAGAGVVEHAKPAEALCGPGPSGADVSPGRRALTHTADGGAWMGGST